MTVEARFAALAAMASRSSRRETSPGVRPSADFGILTFNRAARERYLPREAFLALEDIVVRKGRLDGELAGVVAHGMKEWALQSGATHFCHWFQPQTGATAEKHDSFLSIRGRSSGGWAPAEAIERFSGLQLFQGEPDASSFPSGGARSTFEARGYTMWDPTSPAFVIDVSGCRTLCIPSHFLSYDGQALDEKTPLTRSMQALAKSARRAMAALSMRECAVVPTAGLEQEYFLVDRALFVLRPDLVMSGRTLLGAPPAKGQQLDDHYFSAVKERVLVFMDELDRECARLGIPVKTRHNEVAPMQFELAPSFEAAHIAADHNQLLMNRALAVALRHDFCCLLHEKPFRGLNGSGKHINWSIATEDGENLFEPGETPEANQRFLFFLCAFLEGVSRRGALLRATVATAGNDHRLGANEAPPAVMSVFLGEALSDILDDLARGRTPRSSSRALLDLGLDHLSSLRGHCTDRNRTSPIAFTGDKFEFRACGASQSPGLPLAVLNAAMAEGLELLADELEDCLASGKSRDEALLSVLRQSARRTAFVRFDGNCYSQAWRDEAADRGLECFSDTPSALGVLGREDCLDFFERFGVLSRSETAGRMAVRLEQYVKVRLIEVHCLLDLAGTQVLPALAAHRTAIPDLQSCARWRDGADDCLSGLAEAMSDLESVLPSDSGEAAGEIAGRLVSDVLPAADALRRQCDRAELIVADSLWPLPKYRELLFLV